MEYSHLAADTARKNAALNSLSRTVRVIRGPAEKHCLGQAGLLCSNLHYSVQEEIMNAGGFKNRRWLILSGLFHQEAEKIETALTAEGYLLMDRVRDERWVTLLLRMPCATRLPHGKYYRY